MGPASTNMFLSEAPRPTLDPVQHSDRVTAVDYLLFAGMLFFSALISIYCAFEGVHNTHINFLMASRSLTCGPVGISLTASFMSAVTMLGTPAEIYRYGIKFILFSLSYLLMAVISAEVFLPVYYQLGITTAYEYLELRYNKTMRLIGTVLFMILTVLYTGIVMYSPSLALNQVTGFQLWGSVITTGVFSTFYCTVGGLKAVVWTDIFQFILMIVALLTVILRTMQIKDGFSNILHDARLGGRLDIWDFNPNPLQRHTFWTFAIGGTFTSLSLYGINQVQIQRYLACKTQVQAKLSIYINLLALWLILTCTVLCGLSLYSVYKDCDPWTVQIIKAPDQLLPYLVLDILGNIPGMPGLFVAGTYSGTLSTVSSSINALAAVTVQDFVKPHFSRLSEGNLLSISVGMNLLFGAVCLCMATVVSVLSSLLQASLSLFGMIGGPLLGVFSMGILLPFANTTGAFSGLICGVITLLWVAIGSVMHPPGPHRTMPLYLSTKGCYRFNWTTAVTTIMKPTSSPRPPIQEYWYSLSYLYFSALGTVVTFIVGTIVSLSTGGLNQNVDYKLLFDKRSFMFYFKYVKAKSVMLYERIHPPPQVHPA